MIRSRSRHLDQFYTEIALARELVAHLLTVLSEKGILAPQFLEPSAGEGAFVDALLEQIPMAQFDAFDVDPKHPKVRLGDFFDEEVDPGSVVFGNPPFGKNASLAIQFFDHAAKAAQVIAFIVPRTFEKVSVINRLDSRFEMISQVPVDPLSFRLDGRPVAVPCVFQVWARLPEGQHRKKIPVQTTHPDFHFLKGPEGASFAFQRVGVAAGRTKDLTGRVPATPSHYFLVPREGLPAQVLRDRLDAIDWQPIKERTAGNPSISKGELVAAYISLLAEGCQPSSREKKMT